MSVGCSIIKNPEGGIEYVESPYNGERSVLYQDLLDHTKDEQLAVDLWAVASTPKFQEEVYVPKTVEHKNRLYKQLEGFSPTNDILVPTVYAGGDRVYTLKEDGKILGQIRTTPYKNGHRITMSNINGQQGQGIGSRLYKAVIEDSLKNNLDLYSDTILSDPAQGIWTKLNRFGIANAENKVSYTPFDQNNEPSSGEVLSYVESQSEKAPLDEQQKTDLKISLINTPYNSSEELYKALRKGFYPNGMFAPTRESLRSTRLYNNAEIDNIMSDLDLQDELRDFIQRLKATKGTVYNDIPVDERFMTASQIGVDILGKQISDNPYINQKEALDVLGGIKAREEYQDTLNDSNLDYLKNNEDMFPLFSSHDRAREMYIDPQGNMVQRTSYTKETLQETVKVPENNNLAVNIAYLESIDNGLWETSPQEIKQVLRQVRQDAAEVAIDLDGLEQAYDDISRQQMLDTLNTVLDYITDPTETNLDRLSTTMDTYHSVDTSPKEKIVKVNPTNRGRTLVHLQTDKAAYDLFVDHGLLPLGNDVYQSVRNDDNLDTMYNNLYLNILQNPQILPEETYRTALELDGSLNRSVLNNPRNRDSVIRDIKNFVQGRTRAITSGTSPRTMENLERMYISSVYFNTKLENTRPIPTIESQIPQIEGPVQNQQYLTTEFISDFRISQIKEKQKRSRAHEDYYSNFRVGQNGIIMLNTDPITMARAEIYMDDNMKGYMSLHKYGLPTTVSTDRIADRTIKRNYYTNYPEALSVFQGDYTTVSNRTISAKSTEDFIKVNGKVYESVTGTADRTFYSQLDTNPSIYKNYVTDMARPEIEAAVPVSDNVPVEININNFYTQQQEQEIDDRIECR